MTTPGHELPPEVAAFFVRRQIELAEVYADARERRGELAVRLQKIAAEASQHLRWTLGIDETCSCDPELKP